MSARGRAAKRDATEGPIVEILRAYGAEVHRISGAGLPDLLVRYRGVWTPLEVKSKTGRLTKAQAAISWPVVRNAPDALSAIGVVISA